MERAAQDATFGLYEFLKGTKDDLKDEDEEGTSQGSLVPQMPWDLVAVALPDYFQDVVTRGKLPLAFEERERVLKELPLVAGLPVEGAVNSHRKHGDNKLDRVHKGWKTHYYQAWRLFINLDISVSEASASEDATMSQKLMMKLFALLYDIGVKINTHRKAFSIPHILEKWNPLFTKEDLALADTQNRVNKPGHRGASGKGKSCGKGYGKSFKGYGKGYNNYGGLGSFVFPWAK